MIINKVLFIIVLLFYSFPAFNQKTLVQINPDVEYKKGVELFNKQKYGAAQKQFDKAIEAYGEMNYDLKINAEFYAALCGIELYNYDAEYLISQFISKYPESAKTRMAQFEMGKFRYRQKRYEDAINWFEKVDRSWLSYQEKAEYQFKLGYSYFLQDMYNQASQAFFEIKDIDTKYTSPAVYYYSHIAYINKNHETASTGFKRLTEDETFKSIVPYYITQILFIQRKYEEVIEYAPGFVENAITKRKPEIARIIGESYLVMNNYDEAIPYLEIFDSQAKNKTREDKYILAYTYYRLNSYNKSIELFEVITGESDSLSQNSYYFLADCYLQQNNKEKASLAFSAASKMDFNQAIKEDALYNYAKITFELKLTPFNDAVEAFNNYINQFPNSERIDEAYNYLTMAYMNTRNYKEALASLDNIVNKDNRIKKAYQRIAYFRGLELFNNLKYEQAIVAFEKSLNYSWFNRTIKAKSIYWAGEAYYRLNKYNEAISKYNSFLLSTGAILLDEYNTAHYNLGYCYFKKKDYDSSLIWFRKYVNLNPDENIHILSDAYNRVGDCFYILRKFWIAIENYDKAIALNTSDSDYSLYQKGFALGLVERPNKKIASLTELKNKYPNSSYYDNALFELGRSYMAIHNYEDAAHNYNEIVEKYPSSNYVRQSLLQLGLINYNENNNEEAINFYKRVIEEYDGTPEANNALIGLKNIYVELNDVENYFSYIESLGKGSTVTMTEQDSLTYIAAENRHMTGDCMNSIKNFKNYIDKFPNGNFIINANFYKAECHYINNEYKQALAAYEYVISKPNNDFKEQSIHKAAKIYFDNKDYNKTLFYYSQLELLASLKTSLLDARIGQMNCAIELNDNKKIIETCDKVLHTEQVPAEIMRRTRFSKAKALFAQKELKKAYTEFKITSEDLTSLEGAESKYMVAYIKFLQNYNDEAKKEIMDFISKGTSYQFWLANSFILLADIHLTSDDVFQAKATLQSLIDNYSITDDGVIDEANQKLLLIIKDEKEKEFSESEEVIKLNFKDNTDGKYDELFEGESNKVDTILMPIPDTSDVN